MGGLSSAHFLYLKRGLPGEAIVTFGEAGVPGPTNLLNMVADDVRVISASNKSQLQNLSLTTNDFGDGSAELVGTFSAAPPFRLQLAATFGIFRDSLLKYTSCADVVTTQNDWWNLQDWGMQSGLEITIRDPYMNQPGFGFGGYPGDQCEPGRRSQDGAACVVAVVRFGGELLNADINVTTYASNGSMISSAFQPAEGFGVVILKVPLNASAPYTEVFAKVNYREPSPGQVNGTAYDDVDHWATAYARIDRSPADGFLVV